MISAALMAKATPIILPIACIVFKNFVSKSESLLIDIINDGADLSVDKICGHIESKLKNNQDILDKIRSEPFLNFTGVVMGSVIRRFAHLPQVSQEKEALIRLADQAPEGWITFLKFGCQGMTLENWLAFFSEAKRKPLQTDMALSLRNVPFTTFFNWHVRISPEIQNKLANYVAAELSHVLPVAFFTSDPAAQQAYKQVALDHLVDVHDAVLAIQNKLSNFSETPDWNIKDYSNVLLHHCLSIPLSGEYGNGGLGVINLKSIFIEPDVRCLESKDLKGLSLPKEEMELVVKGKIDFISSQKREHAEGYFNMIREQLPQPALVAIFTAAPCGHIILADAGVGKTSLVRFLVIKWAEEILGSCSAPGPTPIYIELKSYGESAQLDPKLDFLDYLQESIYTPRAMPRNLCVERLLSNQAYLILDGLDEVALPRVRNAIINQANKWVEKGVRVLVTSRIAGFDESNFRESNLWNRWLLLEFSDSQRNSFLDKIGSLLWSGDAVAKLRLSDLRRKFQTFPHIDQLSRNPLLLTLISLMHRNGRIGESRVSIYTEASRCLLDRWEQLRDIKESLMVSEAMKRRIVRRLAVRIYDDKLALRYGENLFPLKLLQNVIREIVDPHGINTERADELVEVLPRLLRERHSLLCWMGGDNYAFVHRSFLEFFVAEAWRDEREKARLTPEEIMDNLFLFREEQGVSRWNHSRYENIIPLYFGLIDELRAEQILEQLSLLLEKEKLPQYMLFMASCMLELQDRGAYVHIESKLIKKIADFAVSAWSEENSTFEQDKINRKLRRQCIEAYVLLNIKANSTIDWLNAIFEDKNYHWALRCEAIKQLGELLSANENLRNSLLSVLNDPVESGNVKNHVISSLMQIWRGESWVKELCCDIILNKKMSEAVRCNVIATCATRWANCGQVKDALKSLIVDADDAGYVRSHAMLILSDGKIPHSWLMEVLLRIKGEQGGRDLMVDKCVSNILDGLAR